MLSANGKEITKYDPWAPKTSDMNILMLDTPDRTFEALNMSASASTLMLIGYESVADPNGGTKQTLKIKTRLADIDTEGWNPILPYTYTEPQTEEQRVIGFEEWKEHALPPGDITGDITILQTGEGNDAREMRIVGQHQGIQGYYFKALQDADWQFEPFINNHNLKFLEVTQHTDVPFQSTVADYKATTFSLPKPLAHVKEIHFKGFGRHSQDTLLELHDEDKGMGLILHRKKTLKNFLGIKGDSYDLILPKHLANNRDLRSIFPGKNKRVQNVKVKETISQITLEGHKFKIVINK